MSLIDNYELDIENLKRKYNYYEIFYKNRLLNDFIEDVKNIFKKYNIIFTPSKALSFLCLLLDLSDLEITNSICYERFGASNIGKILAKKNNLPIFIKITDEFSKKTKLLLFEVINIQIFKMLLKTNLGNEIKKHVDTNNISFITYIFNDLKNCWNYKNDFQNIYSPYNLKNIRNLNKYKQVHLSIRPYIKGKSLYEITINDIDNHLLIKLLNLCNFIINIGFEYGFFHQDLHLKNILINEELIIIDFDTSFFAYYYDNDNTQINLLTYNEIRRLGYHSLKYILKNNAYKELINTYNIIQIKINFQKYLYFIFDLLSLLMNIYLKFIYLDFNSSFIHLISFYLIEFNYNQKRNLIHFNYLYNLKFNNLDELFENYKIILNKIIYDNYEEIYIYILNSILLYCLFLYWLREVKIKNIYINMLSINSPELNEETIKSRYEKYKDSVDYQRSLDISFKMFLIIEEHDEILNYFIDFINNRNYEFPNFLKYLIYK